MYSAKEQDCIAFEDVYFRSRKGSRNFIEKLTHFISKNRWLLVPPEKIRESFEELSETELEITEEFFPAEEETISSYEQYLLSLDDLKGADVSFEKYERYAKRL